MEQMNDWLLYVLNFARMVATYIIRVQMQDVRCLANFVLYVYI
jgi:hypothetical protein